MMPTRSPFQQRSVKPSPRLASMRLGDRYDDKVESPFQAAGALVRRSLNQELQADRKR